jgi:hypothetical protein
MVRQEYNCIKCGVESHVDVDDHADVWSVVQAINADHRKWSPECKAGTRQTIRVKAISNLKENQNAKNN